MPKTNILFILIDSLRADKFYGSGGGSLIPNFTKLIKQGIYFEQAISSANATLLSWAGIFTGKHPFKTGIRPSKFKKLNKNTQTYFDVLKKAGYHFYSFLPPSGKVIGIFPKFENDDCYDVMPRFKMGLDEKLKNFLSSPKKQPWVCYAHSYNLHFPVLTPQGFEDEKFGINNYEKQISLIDNSIGDILKLVDLKNTLLIFTSDHGAYFQTVISNGKKINYETKGDLQNLTLKMTNKIPLPLHSTKTKLFVALEKIKKKKRLKDVNNLNLKPHELRGLLHQRTNPDNFLYDDLVHVPLLLFGHGINGGKIVSEQVRLIDLFPTICDLLKIKNPVGIDGKSLLPLIEGNDFEEAPAYFESSPLIQIKTNDVIGIRTSQFKYFRDRNNPNKRRFLFNLKKDPYEDNNIGNETKTVEEMENILKQITSDYKFLNDGKTIMETNDSDTKKIEDVLKKLGYV